MPTVEEMETIIYEFVIPYSTPRGYDHIPAFKLHVYARTGSKLAVTAAIRCSDICTVWYASRYRLNTDKYREFLSTYYPPKLD